MKKIDILKFIMSFLVIIIHVFCSPDVRYETSSYIGFYTVNTICRLAVPFFFLCSGYFCNIHSLKTVKRLTLLYVIWSIIYYPINEFSLVQFLFKGSVFHLWYIAYSIWGLLLIYFLSKKVSINNIMAGSFFFYVVLYLSGINNQFFFAVFMLALGQCMRDAKVVDKKTNIWLLIISLISLVIEINTIDTNVAVYLSLVPAVVALFNLAKDENAGKGLSLLRKSSTLIYFSHVYIMRIVVAFTVQPWLALIITSVITFAISVFIIKLSEINTFKFLKNLY